MADFQNILALDSAGSGCAAGVYAGGTAFHVTERMTSGQAERLMPMIQDAVGQAGLGFNDIGAIVTTVGPGAFTGLRIGLSAARGLALALNVPLFGVSNLQVLAAQYAAAHKGGGDIAVILETKRADYYFQKFSGDAKAKSEPVAIGGAEIAAQLDGCVVIGDALARFQSETKSGAKFVSGFECVDAGFMAAHFDPVTCIAAEPMYLRGAEIGVSKKIYRPAISA